MRLGRQILAHFVSGCCIAPCIAVNRVFHADGRIPYASVHVEGYSIPKASSSEQGKARGWTSMEKRHHRRFGIERMPRTSPERAIKAPLYCECDTTLNLFAFREVLASQEQLLEEAMIYQAVSALHTISDPHSVLHVLYKKSSEVPLLPQIRSEKSDFIANIPTPIAVVGDRSSLA